MSDLISRVELAIAANGGPDYDEGACECEPEVNASPCRYCAIRDALNETLRYLRTKQDKTMNTENQKTESNFNIHQKH